MLPSNVISWYFLSHLLYARYSVLSVSLTHRVLTYFRTFVYAILCCNTHFPSSLLTHSRSLFRMGVKSYYFLLSGSHPWLPLNYACSFVSFSFSIFPAESCISPLKLFDIPVFQIGSIDHRLYEIRDHICLLFSPPHLPPSLI